MKIRSFGVFFVLAFLLVGCTEIHPVQTTEIATFPDEVVTTGISIVTTEAPIVTTEAPATTEKVESPANPVQVPIEVGDEFEKMAIDSMGYGGINFKHSVRYPKIDRDTPGAIAFNEKLAAPHAPLIKELRDGTEGTNLYRVGYNAAYTGPSYSTVMIHFTSYGGIQYSEGGYSQKFFYYDAINDREITVEEYLESMDVDLDKALDAALWSYDLAKAGFTADYEGEAELKAGTEYKETFDGKILTSTDKNKLYYQRHTEFANSVKLDGAYVDTRYITLYFTGQAYVKSTFSVTLEKETLLPVRPNYEGEIKLTFADTDKIEILFEDGKVTSAVAPFGYEDIKIIFSPNKIDISYPSRLDDPRVVVNGSAPLHWGNAGGTGTDFLYQYFPLEYTPYEELESFVIHVNKDTIPPIQTAMHYVRDAYDVFLGGGKLGVQQRIFYPKITIGTDAAEKFNAKIAEKYESIIDMLETGDDHKIYNISYSYALCEGAISICIDMNISRQGTEGGSYRDMFYFDIANDRELTLEEYASRLNVNTEQAKDGALWSYDLGFAGYGGGEPMYSKTVGGRPAALAKNEFFYQKYGDFDSSVTLDGLAVYDDTVVLYMSGHAYVSNIFTVELERSTLLPVYPNYYIEIDSSLEEEGEFLIKFDDGKTNATISEGVSKVYITASHIGIFTNVPFKTDSFKINGEKWGLIYSGGYDRETETYTYSFTPDIYRTPEELKSVSIEKR